MLPLDQLKRDAITQAADWGPEALKGFQRLVIFPSLCSSSSGLWVPHIYPQGHGQPKIVWWRLWGTHPDPLKTVYRGQPGCLCLLVNGFYFCMDGHMACCMYCVSSGPSLHPPTPPCPAPMPSTSARHPSHPSATPSRGSAASQGMQGAGFGTWPPGQGQGRHCTSSEQ